MVIIVVIVVGDDGVTWQQLFTVHCWRTISRNFCPNYTLYEFTDTGAHALVGGGSGWRQWTGFIVQFHCRTNSAETFNILSWARDGKHDNAAFASRPFGALIWKWYFTRPSRQIDSNILNIWSIRAGHPLLYQLSCGTQWQSLVDVKTLTTGAPSWKPFISYIKTLSGSGIHSILFWASHAFHEMTQIRRHATRIHPFFHYRKYLL